jgi:HAD superfamily hydrolase (TIGR01450 family)
MTRIEGFVFDVDGTLLLSDRALGSYEVLPGAVEVLAALKERSVPFALLTNGSAYAPQEQAAKLRRIGLPVEDSQMVTPSSVMADHVSRLGMKRVLVLGTRGVGQALRDSGIQTVYTGEPDASQVDAVYVGWHPDCGMKDIEAACDAKLYAASDVPFFATKQGRTIGYTFAIVGAIRRLTKARVVVTGKPSLRALRFVADRLGVSVRKMGVVGDDPLVEAVMARRAGATMFAVTTGTTTRQEWLQQPAMRRPHRILDGLGDLLKSGSEVF